jgi:hypothetical protein
MKNDPPGETQSDLVVRFHRLWKNSSIHPIYRSVPTLQPTTAIQGRAISRYVPRSAPAAVQGDSDEGVGGRFLQQRTPVKWVNHPTTPPSSLARGIYPRAVLPAAIVAPLIECNHAA